MSSSSAEKPATIAGECPCHPVVDKWSELYPYIANQKCIPLEDFSMFFKFKGSDRFLSFTLSRYLFSVASKFISCNGRLNRQYLIVTAALDILMPLAFKYQDPSETNLLEDSVHKVRHMSSKTCIVYDWLLKLAKDCFAADGAEECDGHFYAFVNELAMIVPFLEEDLDPVKRFTIDRPSNRLPVWIALRRNIIERNMQYWRYQMKTIKDKTSPLAKMFHIPTEEERGEADPRRNLASNFEDSARVFGRNG